MRIGNLVLLTLFVTGCSATVEDIGRLPVSGQVQWQDSTAPAEGTISMLPESSGPSAITEIVQGKYHFSNANGPVPGKYRVVIIVNNAVNGSGKLDVVAAKASKAEWTFSVEVPTGAESLKPFILELNSENDSE